MRLRQKLLMLALFSLIHKVLAAEVVVKGPELTVTTANAVATFHGPDLVGFTNTLTGESYLRLPSSSPLMDMETVMSSVQQFEQSNWRANTKRGADAAT